MIIPIPTHCIHCNAHCNALQCLQCPLQWLNHEILIKSIGYLSVKFYQNFEMEEKIRRCSGVFIYRTNPEKSEIEYLFIQTANFTDVVGHYLDTYTKSQIQMRNMEEQLRQRVLEYAIQIENHTQK